MAGRVVLVTGGPSGIGAACAEAFVTEGAHVIIAAIREEGFEKAREKGGVAGTITFFQVNVTVADQVAGLMEKIVRDYGRLDCTVNSAGLVGEVGRTADCTEANWDRVIGVNLKGVWLCMKYEIEQMLKQKGGSIVNVASVAGLVGMASGAPAYVASKHAVVGLTKAAALEYARENIRVNAVCPGFIRTPLLARLAGTETRAETQFGARQPVGRLGTPEEVAASVLWLSSSAASLVTGQAMAVDGGYTAQ
jgi:NAD(P)-dependent dehydrogenase (short-subunit alcohol dehydrogenase family)